MTLHIDFLEQTAIPDQTAFGADVTAPEEGSAALSLPLRLDMMVRSQELDGSIMLIEVVVGALRGRCWYRNDIPAPKDAAAACLRQLYQLRPDLSFEGYPALDPDRNHPNCCLAFGLDDDASGTRYIVALLLNRPKGQTSARDRAAATALAPQLAEVLWHYKAEGRKLMLRELESALARSVPWGLVALSWCGTVLAHNTTADEMLKQSDALRIQSGRLHFARAAAARSFSALTEATVRHAPFQPNGRDTAVPVVDTAGNLRFALKVIPYGAARSGPGDPVALVMLADLSGRAVLNECVLASAFTLSAKEARLASLLGNGCSLDEAAQTMSISRNTARIHLSHVLHKTGARNQAGLARLLARLPASPIAPPASGTLQG